MQETRVAVILSGREKFSPYFGGAIARWTYEVYRRTPDWMKVTVFGHPTPPQDRYSLTFEPSKNVWIPNLFSRIPYLGRFEEKMWFWQMMPKLREHDVIHLQNRAHWAIILRQLGYKGTIVGHLNNDHLGHWDAARLDGLAKDLDCVASCSEYIARRFTEKSAAIARRSVVVPNGVNRELFTTSNQPRRGKKVFFAGRFDPQKGVLPLVQSFEAVTRRHPDAELIIGGSTGFGTHQETDYVREVRETAERLISTCKANIKFAGYVDHYKELPRYYQEATIAVFPSVFNEPFGMVICEAMACGTPVITTTRGGIPEVVGDAGILVDQPEPASLAEAINRILDDPGLQEKLQKKSSERAAQFDWNRVAEMWSSVILHAKSGEAMENFRYSAAQVS